ncbi:UbiD family decarboxylase [Pelotomaculum isophthalicicum JI]|uniref:UbiD family decarboxylase n=1 Tax=Pelotomaculum isophthalicicum JI TaxID=947010 RepID=A0A9X4H0S3_9FIRM|nr:UbiD family decarboxylase [Pelotomaculum isophthalicicum]MDF9410057.1 UbiD family decarboxylase [Pelotomaculum isophthalicicum JI]
MSNHYLASLRTTIDHLRSTNRLLETDVEVNPELEMTGIQKHFDGGLPILFNKVKGYPNGRLFTNLYGDGNLIADIYDAGDERTFKWRILEGIRNPLPPREVKDAPCQEVVVDKNIDVWPIIPMIKHTPSDPGRTLGGGNTLATGKWFWGGTHISYNRMFFRGPDFSTFQISPGSHTDMIASKFYRKELIPLTINMGVPPACTLMAGAGFVYTILPPGCDELGIAGRVQGFPVDIVKARTIDAYSIAQAEYVIEGYLDTTQKVWESDLAERDQRQGVYPFHPEWSGYMGKAYRTYKFQVTAVTHRKDKPIYYPLCVHSYDDHNIDTMVRTASFFELAERVCPGLTVDTNIPMAIPDWGGVIFQVKKRRQRDEGFVKNILSTALSCSIGARLAIAVDPDIDIYSMDDVMWAIATRVDAKDDIMIVSPGGAGQTFQPAERSSAGEKDWTQTNIKFSGAIALDATVPYRYVDAFEKAKYPVELVDLKKWFSEDQIAKGKATQGEYAKLFARTGF